MWNKERVADFSRSNLGFQFLPDTREFVSHFFSIFFETLTLKKYGIGRQFSLIIFQQLVGGNFVIKTDWHNERIYWTLCILDRLLPVFDRGRYLSYPIRLDFCKTCSMSIGNIFLKISIGRTLTITLILTLILAKRKTVEYVNLCF